MGKCLTPGPSFPNDAYLPVAFPKGKGDRKICEIFKICCDTGTGSLSPCQIVIDICLCEIVRKFLKIRDCLSNLQTIGVDRTVRVLGQAEFFGKQRTDAKPNAIRARLEMAEVRRRKTWLNRRQTECHPSSLGNG